MVHPAPRDVVVFLWGHLERDLTTLGRALDLNADDTAVALHLILAACSEVTPGDHWGRETAGSDSGVPVLSVLPFCLSYGYNVVHGPEQNIVDANQPHMFPVRGRPPRTSLRHLLYVVPPGT